MQKDEQADPAQEGTARFGNDEGDLVHRWAVCKVERISCGQVRDGAELAETARKRTVGGEDVGGLGERAGDAGKDEAGAVAKLEEAGDVQLVDGIRRAIPLNR